MTQHYAKLETSPRIQRIFAIISDYRWHSTLDIQNKACVCSVGSSMSDLKNGNGYDYETRINDIRPPPLGVLHRFMCSWNNSDIFEGGVMSKKTKTAEELILESFEGSKNQTFLFRSMSNEEYIGYVTAIVASHNLSASFSASDFLDMVRGLFKEGKL